MQIQQCRSKVVPETTNSIKAVQKSMRVWNILFVVDETTHDFRVLCHEDELRDAIDDRLRSELGYADADLALSLPLTVLNKQGESFTV